MNRTDITYEGVDLSRHDQHYRGGYSLPGEYVRLHSHGPANRHKVDASIGSDPRMVTATIVTGTELDDPVNAGGKLVHKVVEYELEGMDGRHRAKAFQPEFKSLHVYGVISERAGRVWLAPLQPSPGSSPGDDLVRSAGPRGRSSGSARATCRISSTSFTPTPSMVSGRASPPGH